MRVSLPDVLADALAEVLLDMLFAVLAPFAATDLHQPPAWVQVRSAQEQTLRRQRGHHRYSLDLRAPRCDRPWGWAAAA